MSYEQKINKVINQLKESVNEGPAESKSIDKMMISLMDMGRKLKDMKQRKQLAVALSAVSDLRNMLK
jgi:septal ring factor EnvC (AmiA/AmiB activator)